ncbi:FAD-dependent monooxygenase [Streptomyces sp. NPDC050704]|uniref:FAD-dependent monooxygenase n=1 Tax=Streptomyces sp. NPDC050704 TaxID=3157219 RepID=UPI003423674E
MTAPENVPESLPDDVPVLVVGGGPVGLSTAFFLACHGVRPLVVEKRATTGQRPRANTSPRTIELFRAAGLGTALEQVGWVPENPYGMVFKERGVGPVLVRNRQPPRYAHRLMTCTPAPRLMATSDQLEKLLVKEVRARGGEVRFGAHLVEFDAGDAGDTGDGGHADDDGVRATVVNTATGERTEITAAYLIGADGARSGIRDRLGLTMPDLETVGTVTTAIYRADIDELRRDRESRFCFVRNAEVYAAIGKVDGKDLWGTHIMDYPGKPDGPVQLPRERIVELLHAAIGDPTVSVELLAATPWEARLGLASGFRRGRVFLAGDAAHVQTSAGGLGMNTGIQDGHNLAWKLAAVLHGQAAPALLDTYEAERRAAAAVSVGFSRFATRDVGIGIGIGSSEGQEPDALFEAHADIHLRAMMFYRYQSDAVITDDRPEADPDALDVFDDDARPGYRLPHHWLTSGQDGKARVSTVDIAGPHWLLLAGPQGHPWLSAAASSDLGIEVRAHRVIPDTDTDAGADAYADDVLGDPDGTFCQVAGIGPDGAVLVRPDGFVCWRAPALGTDPHEALRDTVSRVLGHTRVVTPTR